MKRKRKPTSILIKILFPMLIIFILQEVFCIAALQFSGAFTSISENEVQLMNKKVGDRGNYLQSEMINKWSDIDSAVKNANLVMQNLLYENNFTYTQIDKNSDLYNEFLAETSSSLINIMRTNEVNGAFIVLNSESLDAASKRNLPGVYFSDLDPDDTAPLDNSDILVERSPNYILNSLNLNPSDAWSPLFSFLNEKHDYYDFLYKPYTTAVKNPDLSYNDLAYWSKPYTLLGSKKKSISYSVPLILESGEVYGVMGIEVTTEYLVNLLPSSEFLNSDNDNASYVIVTGERDNPQITSQIISGSYFSSYANEGDSALISPSQKYKQIVSLSIENKKNININGCILDLKLYNKNSPFINENWALMAVTAEEDLFSFSNRFISLMIYTFGTSLLLSIICVFIISCNISKPFHRISKRLNNKHTDKPLRIQKSNILEIDEMLSSIESLSTNLYESASKFSNILEMASVRMGAFEYSKDDKHFFITKSFFKVFGHSEWDENINVESLRNHMEVLDKYRIPSVTTANNEIYMYRIADDEKKDMYIRLKIIKYSDQIMGLAEDVTQEIKEKQKIEYERDYDTLTNLLNRRAFLRNIQMYFSEENKNILGNYGVMMMFDLDNLKYINDTYGHDCGDRYISTAALFISRGFRNENALISRFSGDEFYVFLYGYNNKQQIYSAIESFKKTMSEASLPLIDGQNYRIRISGGIAWYPDNSIGYADLMKYADFAMYKVKHTTKGELGEFSMETYQNEAYLLQNKEELNRIIENELIEYYFQPIVAVDNCCIYAYEALLRPIHSSLKTPFEVLSLARSESKLYQIEWLTWNLSLRTYAEHIKNNMISENSLLFINSIANQTITPEDIKIIEKTYNKLLPNVVLEVTEEENADAGMLSRKQKRMKKWGSLTAMDDYGSGYNSDSMLLKVNPDIVKIDMELVRDVHNNSSKEQIISNLIAYAKKRNIKIIAEGVENYNEMKKLIELGVDFIQGYYLGKPSKIPMKSISQEHIHQIQEIRENCKKAEIHS